MPRPFRFAYLSSPVTILLGAVLLALGVLQDGLLRGEPLPEQIAWWRQDEMRTVAFELSRARAGKVAQWPRMSVPAGAAVLPLPPAAGPIQADGRLDEPAWSQATSFPIGPVFDDWRRGPFMLQVSACRDEKNLYLAVRSPRDLAGLGSPLPGGALFTVDDRPFHVGAGGGLPPQAIGRGGEGQVIELALPLRGDTVLSFVVEALRRRDGKLPSGAASIGLDKHKTPLWLEPIAGRLVPAKTAVRLSLSEETPGTSRLLSQVIEPGKPPVAAERKLAADEENAVLPYSWKTAAEGKNFSIEGFVYREPIAATLAAAREMRKRAATVKSSGAPAGLPSSAENAVGPSNRGTRRELYCRARELRARAHLSLLDAPLLFVKQHPYFSGHIYDDFYPWHPGGGIYVLESPSEPRPGRRVRPIIDPATNETLGEGVYRDPDLFWDASRLVFAFKGAPDGMPSLYEIGVEGRGLRRVTSGGQYADYNPAYLPDGRIVFLSTRPRALVPCFNSGVGTLHTINPDGSGLRSISANNVNEFDPSVMPDGRILYGRWEYVDKTALYMQSLWTMLPDGRMEEALFANNLARPTALLDARAVPGSHQVIASLTPHNGQPVGAIGMIDTHRGKNDLAAVTNFTEEYPVQMDQGLTTGPCDPWPLSESDVLWSSNAIGAHGVIELGDCYGHRELVHCDPAISCYAPMPVKPRERPPVIEPQVAPEQPGRFLVVDVHQGLTGIPKGTIKRLRIVEETARTSGLPPGGRWWNQAFLVSWQGAYIVKNILGTVPVEEDGSAYFEAPPGRALYFEALDGEGREIQRMRSFVQAAPGVTRSCIGCHEYKKSAPLGSAAVPLAMRHPAAKPQPESWGSGYLDYPTMVQPVLDKYCVRCHGGPEGMGKGLDYSGGWTWAFSISYETLIKHRLTGFLNCENGSVHTSKLLPPRSIGSGAARLAEILIRRHPEMSRAERDLMLAWMDTNSNYYGTWDYTQYATCDAILATRGPLAAQMHKAGCTDCHKPGHIGNDWVNLQTPEWSRILRAPMAKAKGSLGLAMCRKRKARVGYPLVDQSVQPPDMVIPSRQPPWDASGEPQVSIASTSDPHYQAMLAIIRHARSEALARPRVDMPGAQVEAGQCRMMVPVSLPDAPPALTAALRPDGAVELSWRRTAETIGLEYEVYRGPAADFPPVAGTQLGLTTAGRFVDELPPVGRQHYSLMVSSGSRRSRPVWASLEVPQPKPPGPPSGLSARALPGEVALSWEGPETAGLRYDVYRGPAGSPASAKLTREPLPRLSFSDVAADGGTKYAYVVRAVDRRGQQSPPSPSVEAAPLPEIKEPVFVADFSRKAEARLADGKTVAGTLHGGAVVDQGALVPGPAGFAAFDHQAEFELSKALSLECWVRIDKEAAMPVILSSGTFMGEGWFLQRFGGGWRWHLAPVSCDGGRPAAGRWTHLVGTFQGSRAALYQDGVLVAQADGEPNPAPWTGPLVVGQYASQAPAYQLHGRIAGVKVYRRALRPAEVAEHFRAGRPIPVAGEH